MPSRRTPAVDRRTLKLAVEFHGHLGPYLVLGLMMGRIAVGKYGFRKYFGTQVEISGASKPPKSCLIDGIQLATGCTYGKANLKRVGGQAVSALFREVDSGRELRITLQPELVKRLARLPGRAEAHRPAVALLAEAPEHLFRVDLCGGTASAPRRARRQGAASP